MYVSVDIEVKSNVKNISFILLFICATPTLLQVNIDSLKHLLFSK